jgi:PHD/YefM family antitoxin component YafN of YafNO toxin-antitoxin module
MKSYSYSEARGNFATVLDEAERDAAVERRSGGNPPP